MKKVEDLVPGDVLVQDGVRFVVKEKIGRASCRERV